MVLFALKGKKCILYQHQHPHLGFHVRGPYVKHLVYLQQDVIFVVSLKKKHTHKPLSTEMKSDHKNILYKIEVLQLLYGKIHRRICLNLLTYSMITSGLADFSLLVRLLNQSLQGKDDVFNQCKKIAAFWKETNMLWRKHFEKRCVSVSTENLEILSKLL